MNKEVFPKVSVIVPAYNTAPYITDMLECVKRQTYINFEAIIINDGSTDDTLNKITACVGTDARFVLVSIPNGGVSNARNLGILKATGDKIFFWDSDDVVEMDTIERCVKYSQEYHCNAVLYGYSDRYDGVNGEPHRTVMGGQYRDESIVTEVVPNFIGHSFDDVNNWIKGVAGMRYGKEHTALWRIMCDANTIKSNHLQFNTCLSLGEDTTFINTYFLYETSVGYLDECFYHLDQREDGANLSSVNHAEKRLADKRKLIHTRMAIDKLAKALHHVDTHTYWEGTLVFGGVEMALKMSKNKSLPWHENLKLYKDFMKEHEVKKAFQKFTPALKFKALPFLFIKYFGATAMFFFCMMLPRQIIQKMSR